MATAAQVDAAVPTGAGTAPQRSLVNALLKDLSAADVFGQSLRNVATRASVCNAFFAGDTQTMCRSAHVLRSPVTALRLLYGAWRGDFQNGETGPGGTTTYTASIEYPSGTFTQVTFGGGATSAAVASLGEVISDEIPVSIPLNATFWIRSWTSNPNGMLYIAKLPALTFGEVFESGAAITDKTMSGTVANGSSNMHTPYAILGISDRSSAFLWGDSRTLGQNDVYTNTRHNDLGILARSVGPTMAYINCGIPSDRLQIIVGNAGANASRRASLATRFCTDAITALGINDMTNGRTAVLAYADLLTIWALLQPLSVFSCTVNPASTSTDSFATTANQTTVASNAQRVALNNLLRTSGMSSGVFDLADVVESARDSGLWKAPGYTADGLHESQLASLAIANSRAIEVGRLA